MSSDELRNRIAEVLMQQWPNTIVRRDAAQVTADAILAMPEMQAMLAEDAEVKRLRAAGDALAAIVGDAVVPYDDESKARKMVAAYDAWKEARRER